jgi:hypothetical protein
MLAFLGMQAVLFCSSVLKIIGYGNAENNLESSCILSSVWDLSDATQILPGDFRRLVNCSQRHGWVTNTPALFSVGFTSLGRLACNTWRFSPFNSGKYSYTNLRKAKFASFLFFFFEFILHNYFNNVYQPRTDHSVRAVQSMNRLRSLEHWDRGFESHWRHGCLC